MRLSPNLQTKSHLPFKGNLKHMICYIGRSAILHNMFLNNSSMNKERSLSSVHCYRKWEKVVQPLVKYDRQSSQLGYPLHFFYQIQQTISAGHSLNLNIATTLTGAKDNCIRTVFQGNEEVGRVSFSPAILKSSFDAEIQKQMQERLSKFCQRDVQFATFYSSLKQSNTCDQMLPWAVIKEKECKGECRALTLSRDEYKKIINLEAHQVAQCFVWGSGKQSSINRFFYFPNKQNSEAFKIDNLQGFMKRRFGKSQFKVRQHFQNSLTFVKIMYTNKSFYKQTLTLVQFLEKHQNIKIHKIVTDWILDPYNRYYLIDLKELSFTKAQKVQRIMRSLTDTLAYLTCAVCQQKYRQQQITKTLTYKLIWEFFEHLKKRQINLSFTPPFKHTAQTSRLCDQCYMLVVSEAELMELERSVALVTHSLHSPNSLTSTPILTGQKGKLFQWRLFFYLEDIRDLVIQNIDTKAAYYIMIRIHNSITSFKLKNPNDKYQLIKGIKVHYLFSDTQKIDKFLSNSQVIIRIAKGPNWNSVLAEGNTSGLYEQSQKHSMRKFKQILVFNQKSKYSVVGIHIGIKMEGRYDPSRLALHKTHDVYMVQDGYSNCYALPAEWMQTIDPSYCVTKTDSNTFSYGLHLAQSEKKALLPTLPKNKNKLVL